jgi:hypothetical protein
MQFILTLSRIEGLDYQAIQNHIIIEVTAALTRFGNTFDSLRVVVRRLQFNIAIKGS